MFVYIKKLAIKKISASEDTLNKMANDRLDAIKSMFSKMKNQEHSQIWDPKDDKGFKAFTEKVLKIKNTDNNNRPKTLTFRAGNKEGESDLEVFAEAGDKDQTKLFMLKKDILSNFKFD